MSKVFRPKGCLTWTGEFRHQGKRKRRATGTRDKKEAEQIARQWETQSYTGTYTGPLIDSITFNDLLKDYERDQRINDVKRPGVALGRIKLHLEPALGWMLAKDIGTDVLSKYVDKRLKEGAAPATINREMAIGRKALRLGYFAKPQKVPVLPKIPHLREDNVRRGFIDPQDFAKLIEACDDLCLRAILEICFTYGHRKSEVLSMRVRQVDFIADVIRLETSKNGDPREVAMTPTVHTLLKQCASGKGPDAFLFTRGDRGRVRDFRTAWKKLCKAAGLDGKLVHDLRRSAARNLRRAGVAEGVIMAIGGWKTRSVFERYNIVDQRDIREALVKREELINLETGLKSRLDSTTTETKYKN